VEPHQRRSALTREPMASTTAAFLLIRRIR